MPTIHQPECRDCSVKRAVHPWLTAYGGHVWLCGDCKLLRERPDAPRYVKLPAERRAKGRQRERLFEV